jgi:hypothetical protein
LQQQQLLQQRRVLPCPACCFHPTCRADTRATIPPQHKYIKAIVRNCTLLYCSIRKKILLYSYKEEQIYRQAC